MLTELTQVPEERRMTAAFKGYQRYKRIEEGAFSDCRNMGSEEAPCASVRRERQYLTNVDADGPVCWLPARATLDGHLLADAVNADGTPAWLTRTGVVSHGKKEWRVREEDEAALENGRLLVFGNGLFEVETGTYIPARDDAYKQTAAVTMTSFFSVLPAVADEEGVYHAVTDLRGAAPENPEEDDYYYNTQVKGLYRYVDGAWQAWPYYHVMLKAASGTPELYRAINQIDVGDRVSVTDGDADEDRTDGVRVAARRAWLFTPADGENYYIVLETKMDISDVSVSAVGDNVTVTVSSREITVRRRYPVMDFCVVSNNRIWGCRFGKNDENVFVNEIYASALGKPQCWFQNDSITSDSWTTGVGEPGPFTGAAVVGGNVVFFKENAMFTVYGETPAGFTVHMDRCAGIATGSDRSAATIGGALYYHSPIGFMRLYAGSLPVLISDEVAYKNKWADVIAGADGRKYYADCDKGGSRELLVYDAATGLWMKEDSEPDTVCMMPINNALAAVVAERDGAYEKITLAYLSPPERIGLAFAGLYLCKRTEVTQAHEDGLIHPYDEGWQAHDNITYEPWVEWSFATGDFGHESPEYKRVKSIAVRAWRDTGADYRIYIMYDEDGDWLELTASDTSKRNRTGTNRVEYRLRRCDVFRLRFTGRGRVCVYSITQVYDTQGDMAYGTH